MSKANNSKGARKVESLSNEEIEEIRQAFDLFDTEGTGKINPKDLKEALQSLNSDDSSTLIKLVADLEASCKGGIDFNTFMNAFNSKLGENDTKEDIKRLFDSFINDPNSKTITLDSLRKIMKEWGESMPIEEIKDLLAKASINGNELTFNEFFDIMTKKELA